MKCPICHKELSKACYILDLTEEQGLEVHLSFHLSETIQKVLTLLEAIGYGDNEDVRNLKKLMEL